MMRASLRRVILPSGQRLTALRRAAETALQFNEHIAEPGGIVFRHACKLGFEGIMARPTVPAVHTTGLR